MIFVLRPALLACSLAGALVFVACSGDNDPAQQASPTITGDTPTIAEPTPNASDAPLAFSIETFAVPAGSRPHDVAPAADGGVWYTAQRREALGYLDPETGATREIHLGAGSAPHGVIVGPDGDIYYASLAGSYIGRVDLDTGVTTVLEPPTPGQGARRVWSDSSGRIWVSEWNAGRLALYDPRADSWQEWPLPARGAQAYAVYVDDRNLVWLSDFGSNTLTLFDPANETFTSIDLPSAPSQVRQLLGRPGELWAPESAADQLVVIRY